MPADRVAAVRMGTTVATNALLERRGEPTVLLITEGFRDALRIAYQNRPRLFDRHIVLPESVHERVIEVPERIDAHGRTVRPLELTSVREQLNAAHAEGLRSAAVVLMHGYRHPAHERAVAEAAREAGFTQVSSSHEVSPLIRLVPRGDTTVVDAYLSPVLGRYVDEVAARLDGIRLMFLQSNGGCAKPPASGARTPSSPDRPEASSAWSAPPSRPAMTGSSASTWAAPPPMCRTTPGSSNASWGRRSPGSGCVPR